VLTWSDVVLDETLPALALRREMEAAFAPAESRLAEAPLAAQ
jgi:hypothetical protein